MKTGLSEHCKVTCFCEVQDERTVKTPPSVVSVGFVDGEREAFDILESKLLDFESFVLNKRGMWVSISEGCIKLRLRVKNIESLNEIDRELRNGELLKNIAEFLYKNGYKGCDSRPALMLVHDMHQVEQIRHQFDCQGRDYLLNITFIKITMHKIKQFSCCAWKCFTLLIFNI
jgi:hypothetical protein